MKLKHFFPCKKAYYVKRKDFFQNFFEKISFFCRDTVPMEPEPEPQLVKSRNRNRNRKK